MIHQSNVFLLFVLCLHWILTRPAIGNDILQDEGLDVIGEGLATLKNMASDMNEVASGASFLVIR